MKVHSNSIKIFLLPIYYLIHYNFFFGIIHKYFFKDFKYRNFMFKLKIQDIPVATRSSFLFKTYEYNDRKLVESYIDKKNKCVVIGGGIGFIPTLAYHKSNNKVLVFEINKKITDNLKYNLELNRCEYNIYDKNLTINEEEKFSDFFLSQNFLLSSKYLKTSETTKIENINYSDVKDIESFNTLIIDGEGIEEYFIYRISNLKKIKYLLFELHHNIFDKEKIQSMFEELKINNFKLVGKCFNSYYFKKD